MYEIEYTGLFKRKVKLLKKRGYDLSMSHQTRLAFGLGKRRKSSCFGNDRYGNPFRHFWITQIRLAFEEPAEGQGFERICQEEHGETVIKNLRIRERESPKRLMVFRGFLIVVTQHHFSSKNRNGKR